MFWTDTGEGLGQKGTGEGLGQKGTGEGLVFSTDVWMEMLMFLLMSENYCTRSCVSLWWWETVLQISTHTHTHTHTHIL